MYSSSTSQKYSFPFEARNHLRMGGLVSNSLVPAVSKRERAYEIHEFAYEAEEDRDRSSTVRRVNQFN